jgi:two-component system, LytTR family, response regulator
MTIAVREHVATRLRVAIVDDEPPARRRVRALLACERDVDVVGEAGDVISAVEMVQSARPDVIFLDIRLSDATGFDVLERLEPDQLPIVVFVTAFDEYALRAFEVHALDYLLKPFDEHRFARTVARVRSQHFAAHGDERARLVNAVAALTRQARAHSARLALRVDGRIKLVAASEIDYVEADSNAVRVHTRGGAHTLRLTLSSVEAQLDASQFVRISRSVLVRIDRIVELEPLFHGEYVVKLRDGTKLTSGRSFRDRLRETLGIA